MAYSEKYYHTYCDNHGNIFRVSLRVWDYEGAATQVECGREQFIIERENSSEVKLGGVYGTRATATFISNSGFDLQELYTGDERSYLLTRLKNGLLDWQGNVVPDGFQQDNFDVSRSQLTVRATDNLTTLKGKQFVDENGDNFGDSDGEYMRSFLWVIKECLKKTGFQTPIWTMVDLKTLLQANSKVFSVRAGINVSLNLVTLMDYTRLLKDEIEVGYKIKMEGHDFTVGSVTTTPLSLYDLINITPSVPISGNNFSGNTTMEVSEPQSVSLIADPLLAEHNIRVWINDSNIEGKSYYEARGGAMMTWDVLDAIARQFGAVIQQNNGHWEIKRWNADKIEAGVYQWFVYNSEGVEIGREEFGADIMLPCIPNESAYRIFGTTLSMDRVLKYAIVNYRYKYKQDGDTLQNLIVNGNFEGPINPNPIGWDRIHVDNVTTIPPMVLTKENTGLPAGLTDALRVRNYANTRTIHNLTTLSNPEVNKGDRLTIQWYEKVEGITGTDFNNSYCGIYALSVWESREAALGGGGGRGSSGRGQGKVYDMVNSGELPAGSEPPSPSPVKTRLKGRWRDQQEDGNGYQHIRFATPYVLGRTASQYGRWRLVEVEVEDVPINGILKFEVVAVAWNIKREFTNITQGDVRKAPVFSPEGTRPSDVYSGSYSKKFKTICGSETGVSVIVTGFFIGKIIDPDNEVVPQIDPFMYPDYQAQLTRRYSDTIPEVEVLTGDDYGEYAEDRISGMWWNGQRTSMWDTWDNRFGWSRQGLVLAKSIMEMYWKPTRLLDCEINLPNLHWSSRIQFEEMPGKRFVILRGSIGGPYSTFNGTLTEIHDDADPALPPGGNDGGNTVEPNWQPTGITRCVRDESGVNTGEVEAVEVDINQASPTHGQERWVDMGTDLTICPVGEPIDIYWGASTLPIDPATLNYFPYEKNGNDYLVNFDNDGTGKYLVFLHRASLGTVNSIRYLNGGWQAYGNLPSWQYEADTTINGYTYKVMRQIYMSGTLNQLPLIFTIQ